MRNRTFPWSAAAIGAVVMLGGCVGEPRTFYEAKPVVPPRPAALRAPAPPMVTAPAPVLSRAAKERLFRGFQQSQSLKQRTLTDQEATPQ